MPAASGRVALPSSASPEAARPDGPLQRFGLTFVLVATMILGPFPLIAPAIVAVDLISTLGITTSTFGIAISANTVAAAVFAPLSGRLTDRFGPKLSTVLTMATAGLGLIVMAYAARLSVLICAAVFAGLGQGWCNPASNKLIAERVPAGRRGTITGIKQSGVMFGSTLAGATLPTLAVAFGWRAAMAVYGVVALVTATGVQIFMRSDRGGRTAVVTHSEATGHARHGPGLLVGGGRHVVAAANGGGWVPVGRRGEAVRRALGQSVPLIQRSNPEAARNAETAAAQLLEATERRVRRRLIGVVTWYSLLMGSIVGGVSRFLPLFAEEALGWTNFWAGMVTALMGVTAVVSRVWWARTTERRVAPLRALALQAALTVGAIALLFAAVDVGGALLWVMAPLAGFSMASWNAVAMLALITGVPVALAGRASGIVMLGFMSGLSVGGLFTGYIVEWTGSYQLVWLLFGACAVASTVLALLYRGPRPAV